MTKWTMQNTEGFSQEQLDEMNSARKLILAKFPDDDEAEYWVDDAISAVWFPRMKAARIAELVLKQRKAA